MCTGDTRTYMWDWIMCSFIRYGDKASAPRTAREQKRDKGDELIGVVRGSGRIVKKRAKSHAILQFKEICATTFCPARVRYAKTRGSKLDPTTLRRTQ